MLQYGNRVYALGSPALALGLKRQHAVLKRVNKFHGGVAHLGEQ